MSKIYAIISGKGGVGKSLGYLEYVSLANGNSIQIGPYVDTLLESSKDKIKQMIVNTNSGQEIFEIIEPEKGFLLNIIKVQDKQIISERREPICIMRKPAPKNLIKIKTANGDIEVTKEHKFLVMRNGNLEKIKAEELIEKKDYLLEFNYPPIIKEFEKGSKDVARLLGYLIGDGYIEKREKRLLIHVFCEDNEEKNLRNIKTTFKKVFGNFAILKNKKTGVCRISFLKNNQIQKIFSEYGVKRETAGKKEIPNKIFNLDNTSCSEFLSALFDCDGHVCKNRNEIQYDTKSKKLAYQLSNLLRTRFKIENQLKQEYKRATNGAAEKQEYFRIIISGEDIYKFYSQIGFKNNFKKERLKEKIHLKNYNTNIKLFPFGKFLKRIRNEYNIPAVKLANILGCTKQMVYEYEWGLYALSKNSASKFINSLKKLGVEEKKLEYLENLLNKGYSFRRVESIEETNYNFPYVYDFQVCEEGGHFVHGTGIVISNTTTAVNLGAALNQFKEDVIIVDTNITTPNIGLYFGAPIVPVNLNHVLQGKAKIEEAIYEHESGTKIVPCSLSLKDMKKVNMKDMKNVIKELSNNTENILLDSAAGLGEEAKTALGSADEIIIVTNPNILSVTDSLKAIKLAEEMKKPVKGVIITRVKNDNTEMPIQNIQEMLEIPILGIVPEDKNVQESLVKKNAVIYTKPRSKASEAYLDIAAKLLGKKKRQLSLAQKFFRAIGI